MRRGDPMGMLTELGALVVLLQAAWLLRDGLIAEAACEDRKVARPPSIPRKLFANVLTGIGVFIAGAFATWDGIAAPIVFAVIAMGEELKNTLSAAKAKSTGTGDNIGTSTGA